MGGHDATVQTDLRQESSQSLAPGLAVVAAGVLLAIGLSRVVPQLSPLLIGLVAGACWAALKTDLEVYGPGCGFAAKRLLRLGIVLLGLQVSGADLLGLGLPLLTVVAASVAITFLGTLWLARRLGLPRATGLLLATGMSICGASAIAAMSGATDADEDEVLTAVALVTAGGFVSMLLLPLLQKPLGLDAVSFGLWSGASVQEVGQVVAAAGVVGSAAMAPAIVVKLARVVLLAPLVAGVSVWARRSASSATASRPPIVPLFVAGFVAAVAVRSLGHVPVAWLHPLQVAQTALLTAGMFGVGAGVRLRSLRLVRGRAITVALSSTTAIAVVSYCGIVLAHS